MNHAHAGNCPRPIAAEVARQARHPSVHDAFNTGRPVASSGRRALEKYAEATDNSTDCSVQGYRRAIAELDERALNTLKVDADLERVAADLHDLLDSATCAELRSPTNGTKWTNEQLLFHMLFGFLLVRALLPMVKGFGRLPDAVSHGFAAALNAATRPFHVVNYLSALPGGRVLRGPALGRLMDSTVGHLRARLARESERTLALAMHFPTGWDPYFKDVMTIADVYAYPTQHYDHHRRQLTTRRALDL